MSEIASGVRADPDVQIVEKVSHGSLHPHDPSWLRSSLRTGNHFDLLLRVGNTDAVAVRGEHVDANMRIGLGILPSFALSCGGSLRRHEDLFSLHVAWIHQGDDPDRLLCGLSNDHLPRAMRAGNAGMGGGRSGLAAVHPGRLELAEGRDGFPDLGPHPLVPISIEEGGEEGVETSQEERKMACGPV